MPPTERPLRGRAVLVTRAAERARPLTGGLEEMGATVEARALIVFEPPVDPRPARRAVEGVDGFDWLLFTSGNGVDFFARLLEEVRGDVVLGDTRVAAVGPGTKRALRARRLRVDVVAEESRAEGLAAALQERLAAGQRVLLVGPEATRDVIPRALETHGVRIDAVAFYRTVASAEAHEIAARVAERAYDAVVFTSPSNWLHLLRAAGSERAALLDALETVGRVAIGPVTAEAMTRDGLPPRAVADSPTGASIARAVLRCFRC